MKSSTRIIFNTAATYTRSVLAVGLALFSSRWILNALGATDFGLFNVVGSLIIFLIFFNTLMASSAARHFAYAIGNGDSNEVNKWFNTSLSIHLFLPVILILVGWPIAEYVVRNVLIIPPERVEACVLVLRISLIASFVNMVSIPFVAMFNAKQRIAEVAFWGVLQAVLIFILAWFLTRVTLDRLLFYAVGMVVIHVLINLGKISRALCLFKECRLQLAYCFDKRRFRELCGFAIWTLIGQSGGVLRNQGSSILINLHFGPVVNAAYGIANQVSVQTAALSASMMSAISPEITTREGRGQRESMINLSIRACKFSVLLVLLFAIPFVMEADFVFKLWLINPPPHAVVLSQLMMATFVVDRLTAGYMHAVNAHGKIAGYQGTVGTLLIMTLPLAWLFLKLGMPPESVGVAFVLVQAACSFGRVLWVRFLFDVPVWHWLSKVVLPCLYVAISACLVSAVPKILLSPGLLRLVLVCTSSLGSMILTCWLVALTYDERSFIRSSVQNTARCAIQKGNRVFQSFNNNYFR